MKILMILKNKWMVLVAMAFLLPLLTGCQEDELPDEIQTLDDAYAVIVGEWEWTESILTDRLGTTVQTPRSEETTRQYVFREDRSMQYIENGSVQESEYRIEEVYEEFFLLRTIETGGSLGMSFNADTLVLTNWATSHAHYFIRK